jgi:hypothetical protein
MDEEAFQKGVADPARSRFRMQTAPQIQQAFISSGQQRGTGLDDTLTRAGVDLDQLINQQMFQQQQLAQNRQVSALSSILGQGKGERGDIPLGTAALEGLSGALSSPGLKGDIGNLLAAIQSGGGQSESIEDTIKPLRKGFERERQVYNPYTGIQQ